MWLAHLSATCKGPKCLIKTKCVPCQTSPRSPTFEDLQLSFLFIYFFLSEWAICYTSARTQTLMGNMLTGGLQNSSAENIYYPVGGKICSLLFFNIIIAKCLWELSYLRIIKFCICMGILAHCTSRFSSSKYKDIFNSGKQAVPFLPLFLSLHLQCQVLKQGPHCSSTAELHPQPFSLSLHVSV